jgi:hypothetical protein
MLLHGSKWFPFDPVYFGVSHHTFLQLNQWYFPVEPKFTDAPPIVPFLNNTCIPNHRGATEGDPVINPPPPEEPQPPPNPMEGAMFNPNTVNTNQQLHQWYQQIRNQTQSDDGMDGDATIYRPAERPKIMEWEDDEPEHETPVKRSNSEKARQALALRQKQREERTKRKLEQAKQWKEEAARIAKNELEAFLQTQKTVEQARQPQPQKQNTSYDPMDILLSRFSSDEEQDVSTEINTDNEQDTPTTEQWQEWQRKKAATERIIHEARMTALDNLKAKEETVTFIDNDQINEERQKHEDEMQNRLKQHQQMVADQLAWDNARREQRAKNESITIKRQLRGKQHNHHCKPHCDTAYTTS